MRLTQLHIVNFKNYVEQRINISDEIILLYGANGSGKTNLLDAIHYISLAKSYFNLSDKYLVTEGMEFMRLRALMTTGDQDEEVVIKYPVKNRREISISTRILDSVSELVGRFPVVFVAPADIKIVIDHSKVRRDFINRILCQEDRNYLQQLISYNKYLQQKNAHLKNEYRPDRLLLTHYNEKLAFHGAYLCKKRSEFSTEFLYSVQHYYDIVASGHEHIGIDYVTDWHDEMAETLDALMNQEIQNRRVMAGVQRDDWQFRINSREFKKYGSQGQIKSFIYSLRLAEYQYLGTKLGCKPILILDDFFEKLDQVRLSALIALINSDDFGQIFLSDTELSRSKSIFEQHGIDFQSFHIVNGSIETE